MRKIVLNQNTYNKLGYYDADTFYFIDNNLKDNDIKNYDNYLLSDEVATIRRIINERNN